MRVLIVGAGAQARLGHMILLTRGDCSPYVFDENPNVAAPWEDCVVFHDWSDLPKYASECQGFLVCISDTKRGERRVELSRYLEACGLMPVSAIHPTVYIAGSVTVGKGLQTYPRAVVNEFTVLADYCILGSNCSVDHDGRIGNGVHIMGGASVAGGVTIGNNASIATNATVLPNVRIGANAIVGAGSVVTKDVPDNVVVVGNPARIVRERGRSKERPHE
jgi:sugar O-acyltransferase (sialic acid O-acetyltransferase NeuD family)